MTTVEHIFPSFSLYITFMLINTQNHHILHEKSLRLCINMNEGNETIDWYISENAVFTISKSNNNQDPLLKTQILN